MSAAAGLLTALLLEGRAPTSRLVTGKPLFKPTAIPEDDIVLTNNPVDVFPLLGLGRLFAWTKYAPLILACYPLNHAFKTAILRNNLPHHTAANADGERNWRLYVQNIRVGSWECASNRSASFSKCGPFSTAFGRSILFCVVVFRLDRIF